MLDRCVGPQDAGHVRLGEVTYCQTLTSCCTFGDLETIFDAAFGCLSPPYRIPPVHQSPSTPPISPKNIGSVGRGPRLREPGPRRGQLHRGRGPREQHALRRPRVAMPRWRFASLAATRPRRFSPKPRKRCTKGILTASVPIGGCEVWCDWTLAGLGTTY